MAGIKRYYRTERGKIIDIRKTKHKISGTGNVYSSNCVVDKIIKSSNVLSDLIIETDIRYDDKLLTEFKSGWYRVAYTFGEKHFYQPSTENITIRLSEELKNKIMSDAIKRDVPLTRIIREILNKHYDA